MTNLELLLTEPPYSLPRAEKHRLLVGELALLTEFHRQHCEPFSRITRTAVAGRAIGLTDIPMVPARLFKSIKLQSIADADVRKVLTSSGTTSQMPSRVAVDVATSSLQVRGLASIMKSFIGPQ